MAISAARQKRSFAKTGTLGGVAAAVRSEILSRFPDSGAFVAIVQRTAGGLIVKVYPRWPEQKIHSGAAE